MTAMLTNVCIISLSSKFLYAVDLANTQKRNLINATQFKHNYYTNESRKHTIDASHLNG